MKSPDRVALHVVNYFAKLGGVSYILIQVTEIIAYLVTVHSEAPATVVSKNFKVYELITYQPKVVPKPTQILISKASDLPKWR